MARLFRVLISSPEIPNLIKATSLIGRILNRLKKREEMVQAHKANKPDRSVLIPGAENEIDSWVRNISNN